MVTLLSLKKKKSKTFILLDKKTGIEIFKGNAHECVEFINLNSGIFTTNIYKIYYAADHEDRSCVAFLVKTVKE